MKIKQVTLENFQSYRTLEFSYHDLGLTLISGPTGVGKSTLLDGPCWILFNTTSKEGAADDVKAWDADGHTTGTAEVETPQGDIVVTRTRGKGANDLYWLETGSHSPIRGKDLTETQKLLESRLGVTAELFLVGAYMHQFSRADSFFIAKAKERREVLENIADLSFAVNLGDETSAARKAAKQSKEAAELELAKVTGKIDSLKEQVETLTIDNAEFDTRRAAKVAELETFLSETIKSIQPWEDFTLQLSIISKQLDALAPKKQVREELQEQLTRLKTRVWEQEKALINIRQENADCPTCKRPMGTADRSEHVAEIGLEIDRLETLKLETQLALQVINKELTVEAKLTSEAHDVSYAQSINERRQEAADRIKGELAALKTTVNPHAARLEESTKKLNVLKAAHRQLIASVAEYEKQVSALSWLYDASLTLRGLLMTQAVSQVESKTNYYLERFFDAQLRVKLTLDDSDKLEAEIFNGGYLSPFKQLSGGERCLIKLSFSLALMEAAQDRAGVDFNCIMLDESLHGLDDTLKVKAYALLQDLQNRYESVLVIDHSQVLGQYFHKAYHVSRNDNGWSTVESSEPQNYQPSLDDGRGLKAREFDTVGDQVGGS